MDEEADNEICCPFCGEADGCKHLLAAFDHGNAEIAGGILLDREEEITELIRKGFETLFVSHGPSVDWGHAPAFSDLWEDCLWRREDPKENPMDSGLLAQLLDDLLGDTDAIREENGDVVAFFDPKPARVYEQVSKVITHAFEVIHGRHSAIRHSEQGNGDGNLPGVSELRGAAGRSEGEKVGPRVVREWT